MQDMIYHDCGKVCLLLIVLNVSINLFSNHNKVEAAALRSFETVKKMNESVIDASTLDGKIMAGYQGWFHTPNDGGLNRWKHWSNGNQIPSADKVHIAMWPDLRELEPSELEATEFQYPNFQNAGVYSSYRKKTVERHLRWMYEYNIDGVFVQRFINEEDGWRKVRDKVLKNVQAGAEKYGRVFANMYDISQGDNFWLYRDIRADWMHLVDNELITQSPNYLHHNGLPVVSIWGFGFDNRPGNPNDALKLVRWFQSERTQAKYRATVMGGVPKIWRNDKSKWSEYYRALDVISPWTVGAMSNLEDVRIHRNNFWTPDIMECDNLNIDYFPVVYPGYSFHNAIHEKEKPFNEIPRLGGTFFWEQLRVAVDAGANMIYVAMFDEVDEGTAVFKIAENSKQIPTTAKFVSLDTDRNLGFRCVPCDWYMSLIGNATMFLRAGVPLPTSMPSLPKTCSSDLSVSEEIFTWIENFLLLIFGLLVKYVTTNLGPIATSFFDLF